VQQLVVAAIIMIAQQQVQAPVQPLVVDQQQQVQVAALQVK
jgi:hypothetical protein